ncbi:MAG: antibiotic biosynthesis monooxygenase family protein [Actinomycetota bacterium]
MICAQFIFRPGVYDEDFRRLDAEIEAYARSLPGFVRIEDWRSPDGTITNAVYYFTDPDSLADLARYPQHLEAKSQVERWYEGYRIVVSEVTTTYGDGRLD